jgi:hypothetical protein
MADYEIERRRRIQQWEADLRQDAEESRGITGDYDRVSAYVIATISLREALVERALGVDMHADSRWGRWAIRGFLPIEPMRLFRLRGVFDSTVPNLGLGARKKLGQVATNAERDRPECRHVVSKYWIEDLAKGCCEKFPLNSRKVNALRQLHAAREKLSPWERLTSMQRVAVAAAGVLGVVSALIPKDAFEIVDGGGSAYSYFRAALLALLIVFALYTTWTAKWVRRFFPDGGGNTRKSAQVMSLVLTYCAIHYESEDGSQGNEPAAGGPPD